MAAREAASAPGTGPLKGFVGGVWKVATSPLQIPFTVIKSSCQKNVLYGATFGLVKGTTTSVSNFVSGTVQVVSSAIPPNPLELVQRKLAYANTGK